MATQNETKRVGDVVIGEALDSIAYSEETKTILSGQTFVMGALGQNSGGKQIVCTTGANCNGIMLDDNPYQPSGADGSAVFAVRGPMVVNYAGLDWGTLGTADKTAAIAALAALDGAILVRTGPTLSTL